MKSFRKELWFEVPTLRAFVFPFKTQLSANLLESFFTIQA